MLKENYCYSLIFCCCCCFYVVGFFFTRNRRDNYKLQNLTGKEENTVRNNIFFHFLSEISFFILGKLSLHAPSFIFDTKNEIGPLL